MDIVIKIFAVIGFITVGIAVWSLIRDLWKKHLEKKEAKKKWQ